MLPREADYFTGSGNETTDTAKWELAMYEAMKEYNHLDEASTYDGRTAGIDAAAAVTPGATTGTAITFTSNNKNYFIYSKFIKNSFLSF